MSWESGKRRLVMSRHYFGASLISRGVSVVAVARWLGRSSPEITYRVYSYMMAKRRRGRTSGNGERDGDANPFRVTNV